MHSSLKFQTCIADPPSIFFTLEVVKAVRIKSDPARQINKASLGVPFGNEGFYYVDVG